MSKLQYAVVDIETGRKLATITRKCELGTTLSFPGAEDVGFVIVDISNEDTYFVRKMNLDY